MYRSYEWHNSSDASKGTPAFPVAADEAAMHGLQPILVVEDDAAVQTMLFMALEDAEYPVEMASNGADALEQLRTLRPRLILLDMRMPVMDGPTFLRQLYAQPDIDIPPIIVMTAYREVDPTALEFGLPSIGKPMNIDQLLQLVRQYARNE
jgi:CheY-like chemotaxis protein